MRILVVSGFFESELPSYREYAYCQQLAALGHDVTLMCGDQSQIWSRSRVKLPQTNPTAKDAEFTSETGVRLFRRHVLMRYSDFVFYWPLISEIRRADVVHVIEFRTGVTVLVAAFAKLFRKAVVYDHEQRGDRLATWYSRADSKLRRMLISVGSLFVDTVRHTVLANREHFISCSARKKIPTMFAPLGMDPSRFFFDVAGRANFRAQHNIAAEQPLAVMSGKLHGYKRVPEVVQACRQAGYRLVLVGTIAEDVKAALAQLPPGDEITLSQVSAQGLREVYSAADVAIFTTFTLSYWEAHATGVKLLVPNTEFSQLVFGDDPDVHHFGKPDMFAVADEEYKPEIHIDGFVADGLRALAAPSPQARASRVRFSSRAQASALADLYQKLVPSKGAA
jgi:glycosyltransferase involved in cell wall biosynthesis